MPRVSVVIPVYNEEPGLPALFARLYPALDALDKSFEIIFILRINPYRVRKESDDVIHSENVLSDNEPSSIFYKCKGIAYLNLFKGKILIKML